MASKLLKKVRARRNLESAWQVIQENGRTSKSRTVRAEIEKFREDVTGNIEVIYRQLQQGMFVFEPAKGLALPKNTPDGTKRSAVRPIVLANVEARIVQRAILNVLTELPKLEPYIVNPNSFGGMRKSARRQLSAVPAAVSAVLDAIGEGARFVMCADISGFFTRISKSEVSALIEGATGDPEFMEFFQSAIRVELSNMAELREHANKFPIEDIGVAQGNSLSPLLGNILLHHFDGEMNAGDCHAKRYIDDFIVLGPTPAATAARMRHARRLLAAHGMELSDSKTSSQSLAVDEEAFEFLGIEFSNGLIRPSSKAKRRLLANITEEFEKSQKAFIACRRDGRMDRSLSLIATLKRIDAMVRGWGKHYRFCNDEVLFARMDDGIDHLIREYVGGYRDARERAPAVSNRALLGVEQLSQMERQSFKWPKALRSMKSAA
jgi:retron-type reverse transcriptase